MDPVRVVVVSDSHLSERTPEASANWRAVVDHVAAAQPDLVVHAGDISTDGARLPGDLDFARRRLDEMERAGAPVLAVPGNHDVGENPYGGAADHGYPLVGPDRLARYRDAIGPDRWHIDLGDWRLVGLDAQVLGSGLPDEDDQWGWLVSVLPSPARPRHVALFLHKPVIDPPDRPDGDSPGRYVPPAAHERLAGILGEARTARAVVSGHVHQFRRHAGDGLAHVWAPTTWAVLPDRLQPVLGAKAPGVVELALGADGTVEAHLRRPAGLAHWVIADDIADPYET